MRGLFQYDDNDIDEAHDDYDDTVRYNTVKLCCPRGEFPLAAI